MSADENTSYVPWDALPEHKKESNRLQAVDIQNKLSAIGCDFSMRMDWGEDLFQFKKREIVKLARMEHKRWVDEMKAKGWRYADVPEKDIINKVHPDMVEWKALKRNAKRKDINSIVAMPSVLADAGFRIYRVTKEP